MIFINQDFEEVATTKENKCSVAMDLGIKSSKSNKSKVKNPAN